MIQQKKRRLTQPQERDRVKLTVLSRILLFSIFSFAHFASAQYSPHEQISIHTQNQESISNLEDDTFPTPPENFRYQPNLSLYEFSTSLEKESQAYTSLPAQPVKKPLKNSNEESSEPENIIIKSLRDGEIKFHTEIGNHWHMDHGVSFKKGKHQHRDNRLELDFHYDF